MPEIDLEPGEYTERKPKGWRWRLPLHHPVAARTPLAMMLALFGFLAYFVVNLPTGYELGVVAGVIVCAFIAGAMFILAFHDN